jgi:hypothetical protein
MRYRNIACLDDLTRPAIGPACELVYDLVRVPVWHSTGIDIAKSPRDGQRHNLAPHFRAEDFLSLCGLPQRHWATLRHGLPPAAAQMLLAALPAQPNDTLVLGADLPPWLTTLLDQAGSDWLSLAIAPLDFGAEHWFEARCHSPVLQAALQAAAVPEAELLTHACLRAAAVRHRRRSAAASDDWNGCLVWLGQAEEDPGLVDGQGHFVRAEAHADAVRAAAADRRLVHCPHTPGSAWAEQERAALARLTGQPVPTCQAPLADLLAGDDEVAFVGLNAPALQAAAWYGKPAVTLLETGGRGVLLPACAVLSEPLWAALLTGEAPRAGAVMLPASAHSLARLLGEPQAAAPARTDPGLAQALDIERQRVDDLRLEIEGLKEALRVVLRQNALAMAHA